MAVVGSGPSLPIHMHWAEEHEVFDNLAELGQTLQFVIEGEFRNSEPIPDFRDSKGRRFRVLVMSLEVVLCVEVDEKYHPSQLSLASIEGSEGVVFEHLDGAIHRILTFSEDSEVFTAAIPDQGNSSFRASEFDAAPPSLSWSEFDALWFKAVDPAPPLNLIKEFRSAIIGFVSRYTGRRQS
ncbi:hypothetical protein [Nocardioides sp. AE5]|uniref:hypothetical protein n=1 Tax=Nocardioides sp. AE5 TaxID=2962573 RepID=UPI002880C35C|nr:hypothetical protein [Nocardioides sp. AE5]MDT0200637.1 hypothetical protein [Nocardioides sp. AE5]